MLFIDVHLPYARDTYDWITPEWPSGYAVLWWWWWWCWGQRRGPGPSSSMSQISRAGKSSRTLLMVWCILFYLPAFLRLYVSLSSSSSAHHHLRHHHRHHVYMRELQEKGVRRWVRHIPCHLGLVHLGLVPPLWTRRLLDYETARIQIESRSSVVEPLESTLTSSPMPVHWYFLIFFLTMNEHYALSIYASIYFFYLLPEYCW